MGGAPDPGDPGGLENRSLTKYYLMIEEAGGWSWFQRLLQTLRAIADRRSADTTSSGPPVTVAMVAAAWVLNRPAVAAIILGPRGPRHMATTTAMLGLKLTGEDCAAIDAVHSPSALQAAAALGPVYG